MKLSTVALLGAGYVLGARAGRGRYEQIVRVSRRVAGSQTVQSTAGVVQAQLDRATAEARHELFGRFTGRSDPRAPRATGPGGPR